MFADNLYDDICFELTNYEHSEDPETTDEEWCDVFYDLLRRVQSAIDFGEIKLHEKELKDLEQYRRSMFIISETCVDASKQHITPEAALQKIRDNIFYTVAPMDD